MDEEVAIRGGCLCQAITYTILLQPRKISKIAIPNSFQKMVGFPELIATVIHVVIAVMHYSKLSHKFGQRELIL